MISSSRGLRHGALIAFPPASRLGSNPRQNEPSYSIVNEGGVSPLNRRNYISRRDAGTRSLKYVLSRSSLRLRALRGSEMRNDRRWSRRRVPKRDESRFWAPPPYTLWPSSVIRPSFPAFPASLRESIMTNWGDSGGKTRVRFFGEKRHFSLTRVGRAITFPAVSSQYLGRSA
jgi:hypothetical protein